MLKHKRLSLFVVLAILVMAVVPAFAQDSAKVEMWIAFTDSRLDWAKQKAADFHAQFPDLPEIDVVGIPNYETLFTNAATAAEQNALPAILQYFEVASQNGLDSGYFKPIADAVGDQTDLHGVPVSLDDFIGPVAAYYSIGGKFNSMPWNVSSAIMFSNVNLLKAAGIDTPPTTWAEVEADCAKIMAGANAPKYCFSWPNHGWFFEQWLAQQDGLYANNDNGRTDRATELVFNSDAGVAILTWLKDMHDKGYLYYSGAQGGDSWDTVSQAFGSQEIAMAIESSSDITQYVDIGTQNGTDVVVSRQPYNQDAPGGWTGNLIGGASLWLTNNLPADIEDAALTWLFWLTNTENTADWSKATGYLPIRLSAVQALTDAGFYTENPNFVVAAQQLADSKSTPATAGALLGDFPTVRNIVTAAIDKALLTPDADVKAILDQAAADANKDLAEYNALNAG